MLFGITFQKAQQVIMCEMRQVLPASLYVNSSTDFRVTTYGSHKVVLTCYLY